MTVYENRRETLYQKMAGNGVDRLLIGRPLNICYLTGLMIKPYERFLALLLDSRSRTTTFILPSLETGISAAAGIPEVLVEDNQDPVARLALCLEDGGTLGLEMQYFPISFGRDLARAFPKIQLSEASGWISEMRLIKDAVEIELIATAARYGDEALAEVRHRIVPGCSEKDLLLALWQAMAAKPGVDMDQFVIQVLSGEKTANPHGYSGDRKFQAGDSITIDYGAYYQRYWSDYCRNFFLGQPDPRLLEIYKIVAEAQLAAIDQVKPGVPMRDIDAAARQVISKAGYGDYFIHRTGHGIGLDIHEEPRLHCDNTAPLQEGMVFTIEPGIYLPDLGGVRIEDDIAVTATGARVLNGYPKDLAQMIL